MIERRVLVVGDAMLDVIVRPSETLNPTSDTRSRIRLTRGGSGANVAAALADCGHHVTYVAAVGPDLAGERFRLGLALAGVNDALEAVEESTGVVVSIVGPDGQRTMLTDRGANRRLTGDHVSRQLALAFDHLHVSGYTLLDSETRAVGADALRVANERGLTTSVDVCSVGPLREVTPSVFLDAAAGATILFANEEEASLLSGASDADGAATELARRFSEVVVTRGAAGALARKGEVRVVAPSRSEGVLDTTGAGDAATGAYLATRLRDGSMLDALEAAMTQAATVVGRLGSGA